MTIDQVRRWHASPEVMAAPEGMTALQELFDHYCLWAERTNQRKVGEVEFSHRLASLGYPVEEIAGQAYHKRISVPKRAAPTPANYFG
jgi:hypothetical protein